MTNYNQPPILKKISFIFTGIVIILLLLIVYYFFGQATITLVPNIKAVSTTFEISVKPEADVTDGSVMPGDIVTKTELITRLFPVAKITEELPGLGQGEIIITNKNSSSQTLVATTRFLTQTKMSWKTPLNTPQQAAPILSQHSDIKGKYYI